MGCPERDCPRFTALRLSDRLIKRTGRLFYLLIARDRQITSAKRFISKWFALLLAMNVRRHVYRHYNTTAVTKKYLCVVVKSIIEDLFMITAYFTDSIKRGEILWEKK